MFLLYSDKIIYAHWWVSFCLFFFNIWNCCWYLSFHGNIKNYASTMGLNKWVCMNCGIRHKHRITFFNNSLNDLLKVLILSIKISSLFRPKKLLLFPEMRVTRKIFTRAAASLFFFNPFSGDIFFSSLVFVFSLVFFLFLLFLFVCWLFFRN